MADKKTGNPFSLDKKKAGFGPKKTFLAKVYTEDEKAEMLNGYVELSEDVWPLVRYGTHMRYVTKEDLFRTGGFVTRNPFDTKPAGGKVEKRFLKMQNGFDRKAPGYAEWVVAYEDIKHMYVKPDAMTMAVQKALENSITSVNNNIRKLVAYTQGLEKRIQSLEGKK